MLNKKRIEQYLPYVFVFLIAILVRISLFNYKSNDYNVFLSAWFDSFKGLSFSNVVKSYEGDYQISYVYILYFLSKLPVFSLYTIKSVSCLFDFLTAFFVAFLLKKVAKSNDDVCFCAFVSILFLPTVVLNSGLWAQCDIIYSFFAVLAVFSLCENKSTLAWIFFSVSIYFKLQAVFILPLFIYVAFISGKQLSLLKGIMLPFIHIILSLPALVCGYPFSNLWKIYFGQVKEYPSLTMSMPNVYMLFNLKNNAFTKIGIIFAFLLYALMLLIIIKNYYKKNRKSAVNIVFLLATWSILTANMLLPRMHERYLFLGDIISVVFFFTDRKKWFVPVGVNLLSVFAYMRFLFLGDKINLRIIAFCAVGFYVLLTAFTVKELNKINANDKTVVSE